MIFRRYLPEDRTAMLAVLRASFGGWQGERSEQYFEWKFERNPHGPARIWVADDDSRVAGCYIWNPVRLRVGGTTVVGAQSVDAAVHPDYQGRGIFTDLARTATQEAGDLVLVYAFPTEGAYKGQLRVGFETAFAVPKLHRLLPTPPLRGARAGALAIRQLQGFDGRFDVFRDLRLAREVAVDRDAEYLRWRYLENPVRRYEVIACEQDGELSGYCVLSIDAGRRLKPGYLVDFQVLPTVPAAAALLLFHGLRRLHELGSRVAVSWERPAGLEREALDRFSFSTRYEAMRRRLGRPRYIAQFIVLDSNPEATRRLVGLATDSDLPPWSLAPGDADYM